MRTLSLSLSLSLLFSLLFSCALYSHAAVAIGATNPTVPVVGHSTGSSIVSPSWTISGSNLVIVVGIVSAGVGVSSVTSTFGGTSTLVKSQSTSTNLYCIVAPTAGTGTVTVTLTGTSSTWTFNADYFTGANQTTPCPTADVTIDTTATNSYSNAAPNVTSNDATYCLVKNGTSLINTVTNSTLIDNGTANDIGTGYNIGTGAVAVTTSDSGTTHELIWARIVAAVATAGPNVGLRGRVGMRGKVGIK